MHRKPMVSLLIGSLVFGLVLVSISWLPEVSGWQQGTLPKKRPAKRVKRAPQPPTATASKSAEESAEKAKTLPQPPSSGVHNSALRSIVRGLAIPPQRPRSRNRGSAVYKREHGRKGAQWQSSVRAREAPPPIGRCSHSDPSE